MEMVEYYDEDLTENRFFEILKEKFPELYESVTGKRWTICVPRADVVRKPKYSLEDFENHIIHPVEDQLNKYLTVNNKELFIQGHTISTGLGFKDSKTVSIFFEVTYFNKNDESFRVLCISQMFDGEDYVVSDEDNLLSGSNLRTLNDCMDFLFKRNIGDTRTRQILDDTISAYRKKFSDLEAKPELSKLINMASTLFNNTMMNVLKDSKLKKHARRQDSIEQTVKVAIETYVLHRLHAVLFTRVCASMADQDARLNKITRNQSHIQLKDLYVRVEFGQNIPRARKELSNLDRYTTPLLKFQCMKRVIKAVSYPVKSNALDGDNILTLTTDDLLPILIFLIVRTEVPNWWANMEYMKNFHFSKYSNDDEFGFYLATLEAALEHVSDDQLSKLDETSPGGPKPLFLAAKESLWQRQDSYGYAVDNLFQLIQKNQLEAVQQILTDNKMYCPASTGVLTPLRLCHPLCRCSRCTQLQEAHDRAKPCKVTVCSRDDKGHIALHVAVTSGNVRIVTFLLAEKSPINAADYQNVSPLHIACQKGFQQLVLLLLDHGAAPNSQDKDGMTPLHLAANNGHDNCINALIYHNRGENHLTGVNVANDMGDTALHLAAKWGYSGIVRTLLENGTLALIPNKRNLLAIDYTHNVNVKQLLQEAASREIASQTLTRSASLQLHRHSLATVASSATVATTTTPQLREQHTKMRSPPTPSTSPASPLTSSASSPLFNDASPKMSRDTISFPSLSRESSVASCSSVDAGIVSDLIASMAVSAGSRGDSNASRDTKQVEKMLKAVDDGDLQMTKYHLGWSENDVDDSDINLSNQKLCHPLCQCERCEPLQRFISPSSTGIHVNSTNAEGYCALHCAALRGHFDLAEYLIKRGASVETKSYKSATTPLHLACKANKLKVVELLVKSGALANVADSRGNTPLHYCRHGDSDAIAAVLLHGGAQINASNVNRNTPLHTACKCGLTNVVKLLAGYPQLNISASNKRGETAIDLIQSDQLLKVLSESLVNKSPEVDSMIRNQAKRFVRQSSTPSDSMEVIKDSKDITEQSPICDTEELHPVVINRLNSVSFSATSRDNFTGDIINVSDTTNNNNSRDDVIHDNVDDIIDDNVDDIIHDNNDSLCASRVEDNSEDMLHVCKMSGDIVACDSNKVITEKLFQHECCYDGSKFARNDANHDDNDDDLLGCMLDDVDDVAQIDDLPSSTKIKEFEFDSVSEDSLTESQKDLAIGDC